MTNSEGLPTETAAAAAPTPGAVERIMMVFFSPGKLGESLRQTSPWFWAIAIVGTVSAIGWLLIPVDLVRQMMEAQAAANPQAQGGAGLETMVKFARYGGAAIGLVFAFLGAAVIAGAVYLVFNLILGQEHSFRQHLSATAHTYWISLLGFLLTIPIWLAKENIEIKLGFGLLLPDNPSSFSGHLLNSITLFGLWGAMALGAIESGLSEGRVSVGKSVGAVLGLYLVWVLVSAARATVFGG